MERIARILHSSRNEDIDGDAQGEAVHHALTESGMGAVVGARLYIH